MQYNFGSGIVIGKRTDLTTPGSLNATPPSFLGTLQDIEIDFDQTLKPLVGNNKVAVDIGTGELKITGKAKFARIQASSYNNLILGMTQTANSGIDLTAGETGSVSGAAYTAANGGSTAFLEDFGVFYGNNGATTDGVQLVSVTSSPTVGQYVPPVSGSAGAYTFNASDNAKNIVVYYSYTVATLQKLALANQLMGTGPVFELIASCPYTYQGQLKKFNLKLNACRASKLSLPFKNQDFMISGFDFQAMADVNNNIGTLALTE